MGRIVCFEYGKEGLMMWFVVCNAKGNLLYQGYSWPMARAALDYAVMKDDGCPSLRIDPKLGP